MLTQLTHFLHGTPARLLTGTGCLLQIVTVVACVGWMGVSSALIMINKYIMSTDGFAYPMALSCLGMLFSSAASFLACRVCPACMHLPGSLPPLFTCSARLGSLPPRLASSSSDWVQLLCNHQWTWSVLS